MELTAKQEEGLKIAVQRFKDHEKYTVIAGYAGSGKSTLVRFIVDALSDYMYEDDVAYAAYTGKAAQVLVNKGNKEACTLHKLLYKAVQNPDGTYSYFRRDRDEIEYKMIVVDECSMCPASIIDDLLALNIYILFCGDPGQLSPIEPDAAGYNLLAKPHIFLDEIMRQAQDSGIIRLSMLIRQGKDFSNFESDETMIVTSNEVFPEMLNWADQVICSKNDTRRFLNQTMKASRGLGTEICDGDKIICCHNYWDYFGSEENPLTNGTIGTLQTPHLITKVCPSNKRVGFIGKPFTVVNGNLKSDIGEEFLNLNMDSQFLANGTPTFSSADEYKMRKWVKTRECIPYKFELGYAITAWKAQGSEFDKVVGFEEPFPYGEEHKKYLYTLATRASKQLVLVRT